MREIVERFNRGDQIPAHDFNHGGLDVFSDLVWPMVLKEQVTRQGSLNIEGFNGDIFYQRVKPLEVPMTPEQEYLLRPTELHNGTTSHYPTVEQRLREVRAELNSLNLIASRENIYKK